MPGRRGARDRAGGQASLFGGSAIAEVLKPALLECEAFDPLVKLSKERQAVGFFLLLLIGLFGRFDFDVAVLVPYVASIIRNYWVPFIQS
mgnify:CR=1 FL=1